MADKSPTLSGLAWNGYLPNHDAAQCWLCSCVITYILIHPGFSKDFPKMARMRLFIADKSPTLSGLALVWIPN